MSSTPSFHPMSSTSPLLGVWGVFLLMCLCTLARAQTLAPQIQPMSAATATACQAYSSAVPALTDPAQMAPVTWQLLNGPPGMTISADGHVEWTPSTGTTSTIRVQATNALGSATVIWDVYAAYAIPDMGMTLPDVTLQCGDSYASNFGLPDSSTPCNGNTYYSLVNNGGSGLVLDRASARLILNNASLGTYNVEVRHNNSVGFTSQSFTLTVGPARPVITGPQNNFPQVTCGSTVFHQLNLANRNCALPFTWSITQGPPGAFVNQNGLVSCTPGAPGDYPITATCSNAAGSTNWGFIARVNPTAPILTTNPGNATISCGASYTGPSFTLQSSCMGTPSFSFSGGPPGATMNPANGVITASAVPPGSYPTTVLCFNGSGSGSSRSWTVTAVVPDLGFEYPQGSFGPPPLNLPPRAHRLTCGQSFSIAPSSITDACGATTTYSVGATAFIQNLSVNSAGVVTGTISQTSQPITVSVTRRHSFGQPATATFMIAVETAAAQFASIPDVTISCDQIFFLSLPQILNPACAPANASWFCSFRNAELRTPEFGGGRYFQSNPPHDLGSQQVYISYGGSSTSFIVNVVPPPVNFARQSSTVCRGESARIEIVTRFNTTYRWQVQTIAGDWQDLQDGVLPASTGSLATVTGSSGRMLNINGVDATVRYRCRGTHACGSGYSDVATVALGVSPQCPTDYNHNGIPDADDIAAGASADCNADAIPDESQHLNTPAVFDGSCSLLLSGDAQYVEAPNSPGNNPASFTIEFWVKHIGALGEDRYRSPLASRSSAPDFTDLRGYTFYLTPDDHWGFMSGTGVYDASWNWMQSTSTLTTGAWTHLAATHDAATATMTLYVNGIAEATATDVTFAPNTESPLRIGAGVTEGAANYFFPGQIDDVRIWSVVRTPAQIAEFRNHRLAGTEAGLNTLYQLDDASSQIAHDSAAAEGAADGVIINATFALAAACSPPCLADFNGDASIDPDDLGDFINCYFALPPCEQADFNRDLNIDPDDLGDFINVFFGGCP